MSAPTQPQIDDMMAVAGSGSQQSNGAFLNGTVPYYLDSLYKAIDAARQEFLIGTGEAIDMYTGFLIKNDMAGGTLTPDSTSPDSMLAFVGRVREIYAEQNP